MFSHIYKVPIIKLNIMDMLYFMSYLKFSNINCIGYHFTNSKMFGSLRKEKRIKKRRKKDNLTIATLHFVFMI